MVLQGIREIEPVTVLGIAVVADIPGKNPAPIAHKLEVLESLVPLWHIEYFPALRITPMADLAAWGPGDDIDTTRRGKKIPLIERPPAHIAQVGHDIFHAAAHVVDTQKHKQEKE